MSADPVASRRSVIQYAKWVDSMLGLRRQLKAREHWLLENGLRNDAERRGFMVCKHYRGPRNVPASRILARNPMFDMLD